MKTQLVSIFLIFMLCLYNCEKVPSTKDFILEEVDLIPEGVAVDSRTGIIYIGSTYKRKIVQITPDGTVSDFISQEQDSVWSILGMKVDAENGLLWVNTAHIHEVMPLINPLPNKDWLTTISVFDIEKKKLIKEYQLHEPKSAFNDLTIMPDGSIFATESANNEIYWISKKNDSLALFLALKDYRFPNGIEYVEKANALFVSTIQGILKIDMDSKKYQLLKERDTKHAKGIDGLTFYKDYFIGHQSSKISKFYVNEDFTEITKVELLDSGEDFDASTTGEVSKSDYYYIVNSQIQSGIDFKNRIIKPLDSLEKVIIRKKRLND
ncbi:hypothetical protein RQM59_08160 [Flavobacteriaceae bacterium S356]|uniref:Gluconolaconase n=1 Tax=Asprobacillus argus TaxID=3076534 RepID=A0ABU3LFC0_9FLAO|nr:hypothetical protein [Flavobacteriaceae bacterium S356]